MGIFHPSYVPKAIVQLVSVLPQVIILLVVSLIFGISLGLFFTIVRIKKIKILDKIVEFIISFLKGTPQVVQLFIVYYGIPQLLKSIGLEVATDNRLIFVVITFSLNSSATFSETFRSAYLAVDRGQMEAAYSIGMTGWQGFKKVLFPQAFRVALPNLGNLTVRLLQSTSLAFTIGMIDLMGRAQIVDNWTYGVNRLEIYVAVSLIYWGICLVIECFINKLEKVYAVGYVNFSKVQG